MNGFGNVSRIDAGRTGDPTDDGDMEWSTPQIKPGDTHKPGIREIEGKEVN